MESLCIVYKEMMTAFLAWPSPIPRTDKRVIPGSSIRMYLYASRMYSYFSRAYSYVTRMYSDVT